MSRNMMYFILLIIIICAFYFGYQYYLESQEGIDIEIDSNGVSIDRK